MARTFSLARAVALTGLALGLINCASPEPRTSLAPLESMPRFAVISSDYLSTSIALLDDEGEFVDPDWINSGSAPVGLATALSGDVTLPTEAIRPGELALIDRLGVDLITRLAIPSGEVLGQHRTALSGVGGGAFRANPHDFISSSASTLIVSRFEPNLAPDAAPLNLGNDLIFLDLDTGEPTARVDLDGLDVRVEEERHYARPSRMVRVGAHIVFGLARQSVDFLSTGPGAVGVIVADGSRPPEAVELEGVTGCTEVRPVPDAPDAVVVTCRGPSFVDEALRRTQAGVFLLRVDEGAVRIESGYRVSDGPDRLGIWGSAIPVDAAHVVVIGRETDGSEGYYLVNLLDGTTTTLLANAPPFALGVGSLFGDLLILPDADRGRLVRFRRQTSMDFQALPALDLPSGARLPPREVRVMRP